MTDILASNVVMIRPRAFGFNSETAASNSFQKPLNKVSNQDIQKLARDEFDTMVKILEGTGVNVMVFEDLDIPKTPDAVFPNNWFCTHPHGPLMTFPMESPTRRLERRNDILNQIQGMIHKPLERSLENFELDKAYLEGTGSLVLDHQNKLVYAAISSRTHPKVIEEYERLSDYKAVLFKAYGPKGEKIYHTNVILCLGPDFAILGADTIAKNDKKRVLETLTSTGKSILTLSNEQVYNHFAGNMLCLQSDSGNRILVMSETAYTSLSREQKTTIINEYHCQIVSSSIPTIERLGGGSARCMLAEIFL